MREDEVQQNGKSEIGEAMSFWFAIASPLTGVIIGFLGAWFYTCLSG